ncbi:MAG: efflux RND transporter periplasmic adaptor subunit [Bryobacteraceae bacterium]
MATTLISSRPEPVEAEIPAPVPHHRPRTMWLALIAFVLVIAAAVAFFYVRRESKPQYTTAMVDRGDIESAITATGNCNAVVTVQVGSQVSGNIIALYADFNTKVKQGQLVARIDPAIFKAQVDQAKANLDTAKAAAMTARATLQKSLSDLASAQANVAAQKANVVKAQSVVALDKVENERRIVLLRQDATSKEDADTAQANYDQAVASVDAAQAAEKASEAAEESAKKQVEVAQTQLDQAEATVKQNDAALVQAQLNLDHTQITAPVDGTVVSRNMDVGQTVAASFQAPVIFLIAQDLTKMQVDTNVDESDVGPIRVGQTANFTVDAYPGVVFPGTVAQIRQAPINVQNVITYDVVVQVANPDLKLFPGMTATVRIVSGKVLQALRIPVAALRFHPTGYAVKQKGQQTVYLLAAGGLTPASVQLGITDGKYVQVLSGLTEGQRIGVGATPNTRATSNTTGTGRVGF